MSQIFDALQRTEADRSGIELSAARELLEVVERNTGQSAAPNERRKVNTAPPSERRRANTAPNQLGQFQGTRALVSPQSKLVCITDVESLAAEKFRFLGIRLRHLQQKRPLKCILITSSVAGEGKSTIAANLACALAGNKQQKVLLLEGDLRRPSLGQQLGLAELPGLSELLEGDSDPTANIYRPEGLGLCILPAGRPSRNPLEILQLGKLSMLMKRLEGGFDWIVIDSPPVLPLADTSIWMRLADAVLLVTRPGTTTKRQLQQSLEAIEQSKLLGAVLNGSNEAIANHYYYYSARSAVPLNATAK
jgi:capsular exopolysaccharide synthesis family protein